MRYWVNLLNWLKEICNNNAKKLNPKNRLCFVKNILYCLYSFICLPTSCRGPERNPHNLFLLILVMSVIICLFVCVCVKNTQVFFLIHLLPIYPFTSQLPISVATNDTFTDLSPFVEVLIIWEELSRVTAKSAFDSVVNRFDIQP